MTDIEKTMEELDEVEGHIESEWKRINRDIKGANPKDLRGVDYNWYREALEQLEPYYQEARHLHEIVENHLLESLEESTESLEKSSGRLTKLTWGLLSLTIVLTTLTAVLVLRSF